LVPEEKLTPEETLTLWVYERQQPLLRSTNEMEPCYGRLQAILKSLYIRSICALPLTTAHRKLGAITFGSKQVDTYSPSEVRFVSQVASYIALAFDDALNLAALRRATEELQSKNARLQLLLDVTNQVVANLELRDLLRAISQDVRRVMQCDYAGLSLPDAENKQLRLYAVDFPDGKGFLQEDLLYSIEGSPSGKAFRTMKPLTLQSPFHRLAPLPNRADRRSRRFEVLLLFAFDHPESRDWDLGSRPAPRLCLHSSGYEFSEPGGKPDCSRRRECACLPRDSRTERAAREGKTLFGR
jgi:GAF domain-containing protein